MAARQRRLDRFLSQRLGINMRDVKPMLAQGRIRVDQRTAREADLLINAFSDIQIDGRSVQANTARYIMLNKPAGFISATKDPQHPTVLDLLDMPATDDLHIVGRLDKDSTGLLLLSNDGRWSQALMRPSHKIKKVYRVEVEKPITSEYVSAFEQGMYFATEDITTRPAQLELLTERCAIVTLDEGRYHQIKRMFGRFRNRVLSIHRTHIGHIALDNKLAPGEYKDLSSAQVQLPQGI
ncbi:MAG: 16S rRNA pseudouridine(516) synthase [Pseudohongiellaceae bacterium]|nr:16S rRNA pseudouridine(516) synthase [Pseudohongiellaceae bacterium]